METPLKEPPGSFLHPRISPDGQRLAYNVLRHGTRERDVWVYDLKREASTKLTFNGDNDAPVWSPDSQRVLFANLAAVDGGLTLVPVDGSGPAERLTSKSQPSSWPLTGNIVAVLERRDPVGQLSVLSMDGERQTRPFGESRFRVTHPAFSADARWLAYARRSLAVWKSTFKGTRDPARRSAFRQTEALSLCGRGMDESCSTGDRIRGRDNLAQ